MKTKRQKTRLNQSADERSSFRFGPREEDAIAMYGNGSVDIRETTGPSWLPDSDDEDLKDHDLQDHDTTTPQSEIALLTVVRN